jgi:Domain of unknown function (DUF5668)
MAFRLRPEALTLGLTLVGVGTLALLANLGRLDFLDTLHAWWPLSLLVWGVLEIAASLARQERRS